MTKENRDRGFINRALGIVERVGNALPHPAPLFAGFALLVIIVSWVASQFNLQVTHPGTGELIEPVNLVSVEGLHRILTEMVTNFTGFAPLGVVLVAMLGIGIAETSGLIGAAIRLLVLSSPKKMMSYFALIVAFINRYDKDAGIGTVIATMLPYSVAFFIIWTALLIIWLTLGIPIDPDAPIDYNFVPK